MIDLCSDDSRAVCCAFETLVSVGEPVPLTSKDKECTRALLVRDVAHLGLGEDLYGFYECLSACGIIFRLSADMRVLVAYHPALSFQLTPTAMLGLRRCNDSRLIAMLKGGVDKVASHVCVDVDLFMGEAGSRLDVLLVEHVEAEPFYMPAPRLIEEVLEENN